MSIKFGDMQIQSTHRAKTAFPYWIKLKKRTRGEELITILLLLTVETILHTRLIRYNVVFSNL